MEINGLSNSMPAAAGASSGGGTEAKISQLEHKIEQLSAEQQRAASQNNEKKAQSLQKQIENLKKQLQQLEQRENKDQGKSQAVKPEEGEALERDPSVQLSSVGQLVDETA